MTRYVDEPLPRPYSTGALTDPRPDDQDFIDEGEAIAQAKKDSVEMFKTQPRAVWHTEDGEILWIVYEGRLYSDEP